MMDPSSEHQLLHASQQQHDPQGLPKQNDMLSHPPQTPDPNVDLTGSLPTSLDSLSLGAGPPGTKPFYSYSTLIEYVIKGSPTGKLLLEDIYSAIESRFSYFRTAPSGWKRSVRFTLSLNPCFEKVSRPLTDPGKGSYWTFNDAVDNTHRCTSREAKSNGYSQ